MSGAKVPAPDENGTWKSGVPQIREALKGVTRTGFQRGNIVLRFQRGAEVLPVAAILRRAWKKPRPQTSKGPQYAHSQP